MVSGINRFIASDSSFRSFTIESFFLFGFGGKLESMYRFWGFLVLPRNSQRGRLKMLYLYNLLALLRDKTLLSLFLFSRLGGIRFHCIGSFGFATE